MLEEKIPHGQKRREVLERYIEQLNETHDDTNTQKAIAEKHYLGIALSCSAVDDIETKGLQTCLEAAKSLNEIQTCGIIEKVRVTKTRKGRNPGQVMCFLTISDSTFNLDNIVVFPNCYQSVRKLLNVDQIIRLTGEKKGSSIITTRIENII